jgi:hypothetical protein
MKEIFEYCSMSKLLLVKWIGKFSMDGYMSGIERFVVETEKNEIENVIHDIRKLDFNFKQNDIKAIANARIEHIDNMHNSIYITSKPQDVVFAILFAELIKNRNINHCSTIEMAIKLLGQEANYENIYTVFKKLETRVS